MTRSIVLFGLAIGSVFAQSGTPDTITFAQISGQDLLADVYLPAGKGPFPAAVYLHGGGWSSGDRKQLRRQAAYLAKLGVFGLAIEYRLAPANRYPLAVYDAKAAVRFLRANAAKYNLDPRRIFAIGSSAGGHLAALLGTTNGDADLEGDVCCKGFSSDVTAVVAFNPVLDLGDLEGKDANAIKFLGAACSENAVLCRQASPLRRVSAKTAPMLLLHGTGDQTVPYRQSKGMFEALQGLKVRSRLFTAEGAPHTFWSAEKWFADWEREMREFLEPWLNQR